MYHARSTLRRATTAAAVAAVAAGLITAGPAAFADPSPTPSSGPTNEPGADLVTLDEVEPGPKTITLVTGDVVRLTEVGTGQYQTEVDPAPRPNGRIPTFVGSATDGEDEFHLYPSDVMPAVRSGLLDGTLFDLEYLAEHGFTDDETDSVPVIAQYSSARSQRSLTASAEALPASAPTLALSSVHAEALAVSKESAEDFWSAIRPAETSPGARPNAPSTGLAKLWLDREVTVTLDESVPMIGAPQAWAEGLDGTGVTVAVLDTGYDENHPDLAGKVTESKSFVSGGTTAHDGHGHGTHVASTITGSGAASDGRYKGAAPGVELMVGKVLTDFGRGSASTVIAGMEWAATNGADIISMSLGSGPSDGTDIQSQAVNDLTASTGALFVISAGNNGQRGGYTVGAPGAADAALTVAAVDKSDQVPTFSSRGPRLDDALKPDIAAPGVAITAARSAGTNMGGLATVVDEFYDTASGTSMAAPHVAGAAAILAQAHPDWTAAELKAALMSTSVDDGFSVYEQGAGRVDVATAVDQTVVATTPNADFGRVPDDADPLTRDITYRNTGDTDVTLTLNPTLRIANSDPVPNALNVADAITVPAGGTATATVRLDPAGLTEGNYTGAITATDDASGTRVTTPVGFVRQPPLVTLTIRTLDGVGRSITPTLISVLDVTGGRGAFTRGAQWVAPGVLEIPVTKTTINVTAIMDWVDEDRRYDIAHLTAPEVEVTEDTEITLDARQAEQVTFDTSRPAERSPQSGQTTMVSLRTGPDGSRSRLWTYAAAYVEFWALPTEPVTKGDYLLAAHMTLATPEVAMRVRGHSGIDLHPAVFPHILDELAGGQGLTRVPFTGTHTWDLVNVGTGSPEEISGLDLTGKLVLLDDNGQCAIGTHQLHSLRDAGAAGVLAWPSAELNTACFNGPFVPLPILPSDESLEIGIPSVSIPPVDARALIDELDTDPISITVTGTPQSPYVYEAHAYQRGGVSDSLNYDLTDRNVTRVDSEYHATEPMVFTQKSDAFDPSEPIGEGTRLPPFVGPGARTHFIGPVDPDLVYWRNAGVEGRFGNNKVGRFDHPTRVRDVWNATAAVPASPTFDNTIAGMIDADAPVFGHQNIGQCAMCRHGDEFYPAFDHEYGDGMSSGSFFAPELTHLYQGEREIPINTDLRFPKYDLAPEPADYRLTLDDPSVRTHTEWTFHDEGTATEDLTASILWCGAAFTDPDRPCRPEPLVYATYDLGDRLGLDNKVTAGGAHLFTINAYHSPSRAEMPRIAGVRLWYSLDDGDHWIPALTVPKGNGEYQALTIYPPYGLTSGAVSLKLQAWDRAGNTLTQTTTRAFELRPWHSRHTGPTAR